MATALTIIKRARRMLNALAVGETLESELANDGLEALNAMLDSWSINQLATYVTSIKTLNLTNSQTYTVGVGGTFNIPRPDRIESAFITVTDNDYPIEIIDNVQWNSITNKDTFATIPSFMKYDAYMPLGLISLFPKPLEGTLTINYFEPLQSFNSLTEELVLPKGYELALASNLAMQIAPETGKPVTNDIARIARDSKAAIMTINAKMPVLRVDQTLTGRSRFGAWQLGLST